MPGKLILDIEKAVREWAWDEYSDTESWRQKRLRKKEENNPNMYVGMHINWEDVKFSDATMWPRLDADTFDDENKNSKNSSATASNNVKMDSNLPGAIKETPKAEMNLGAMKMVDPHQRPDHGKIHASVLFQTRFVNNTEGDQEYTIKTEKSTSSTCSTEIEHGWTKSFELGITLKTPCEVLEANAGYSRSVSLTNTEGQTFEEVLSWGVESLIKVKANHVAEAELVVDEKKYTGDFEVQTIISGMVYISFTNIRDNNSTIKATGHEFSEIVKWYMSRESRKGRNYEFVKVDEDTNTVTITTKGKCRFRFGIKQEVVVHQVKISKA